MASRGLLIHLRPTHRPKRPKGNNHSIKFIHPINKIRGKLNEKHKPCSIITKRKYISYAQSTEVQ